MKVWMVCVLAVCVMGVTGCGSKESKAEKQAARAEQLRQEVEAQFAAIAELQSNGELDAAVALIEQCLANAKYKNYRPAFFSQKVDLLLAQDKSEEAGGIVLAALEKEPQLARGTLGRVHAYHQGRGDHAAVFGWSKLLLAAGKGAALPKDLHPQVLGWQLAAAVATGDSAAVAEAVDQVIARLAPKAGVTRLQEVVGSLIAAEKFALASEVIECLAAKGGAAQEYKALAVTLRLRNVLAQKDWGKVPAAIEACTAQLQDGDLAAQLRQTAQAFQKGGQVALLEPICKNLFLAVPGKEAAAGLAARLWLDIGVASDKRVLPERLVALLEAKVQAEQVADLFERHFYLLAEDPSAIKTLLAVGERIVGACSDKETIDRLTIKRLDGAFIIEDYDLALDMLGQGIPGQSPQWHEMSIPKVKAHRALAQSKTLEAIGHFRAFMKVLADVGPEEEHDPTSGVVYSREWILGRNAHRIAGLYESISETDNAAKAREEAKALFAAALAKAKDDDDTLKQLKAELQEMGLPPQQ